jgi:hypothetical protein
MRVTRRVDFTTDSATLWRMENDDVAARPAGLEEHDVAAVEAILIRTVRAQDQTTLDREEVTRLNARITANAEVRDSAYAALKVFGFAGGEGVNRWELVRQAIGDERYFRAVAVARGTESPPLLEHMGGGEPRAEKATRSAVPIRIAVLEYLRSLEGGATARQVRQHLLSAHGIETHEKTPGMTLYRLMKDGLARREGRTWHATANEEDESDADTKTGADLA